jgi:hypothetical protein
MEFMLRYLTMTSCKWQGALGAGGMIPKVTASLRRLGVSTPPTFTAPFQPCHHVLLQLGRLHRKAVYRCRRIELMQI